MIISYDDIIKQFNEEWDFSYLTFKEIQEVLNHPIKYTNLIERFVLEGFDFPEDTIFLVVVKQTQDFDYSLYANFEEIIQKKLPQLSYEEFWCNYKYAAVQAGLGQYAKNSLFYHPKFHFETHLIVLILHNKIINLPQRNKANFNLLNLCQGCNDCAASCPVGAIHNEDVSNIWIDTYKCDNFCHFGNHQIIPSIKWNWIKFQDINLSYNQIYNIINFQNCRQICGKVPDGTVYINGEKYSPQFPVCRECTSQKKCSKYYGKYPYDWNKIKLTKELS